MARRFTMPKDFDRMPIGLYMRIRRSGALAIAGQKSEMPQSQTYQVWGPIPIPERRALIKGVGLPVLDFDGLKKPIDALIRELKTVR